MARDERTVVFQLPTSLTGSLAAVAGSVAGRSWDLSAGTFTIGRLESCDLSLPTEAGVSKTHAKIVAEGDTYVLYDLESRNGTLLNGQPIQRQPLRDGDEIRVCNCVLRVSVRADQEGATAVKQFDPPRVSEPSEPSVTSPSSPSGGGEPVLAYDDPERQRMTDVSLTRARKRSAATLAVWYVAGLLSTLVVGGGASAALVATAPTPEQLAVNGAPKTAEDAVKAEAAAQEKAEKAAEKPATPAAGDAPAATPPATPPEATPPAATPPAEPPKEEPKVAAAPPPREEPKVEAAATKAKEAPQPPPVAEKEEKKATKSTKVAKAEEPKAEPAASTPEPAAPPPKEEATPAPAAEAKWYAAAVEEGKSADVKSKAGGKVRSVEAADGAMVAKGDPIVLFGEGASKGEIATLKESIRSLEGIAADNEDAARQLEEQKAKLQALLNADKGGSVQAPLAGKLTGLAVRAGDTVKPGQLIAKIVEGGTLARVRITVDKADASRAKKGGKVELKGKNGASSAGTILSVSKTSVLIDPGILDANDVAEVRIK